MIHLFISLATQWDRAGPAGVRVGLKYEAVPALAAGLGIVATPALWRDLQVLEHAALDEWARA